MSESEYSTKRHLNSSSDATSGRCEKSTISAQTAAGSNSQHLSRGTNLGNINTKAPTNKVPKYSQVDYDEPDIENQNLCNKRNEKLSKPCKNGFCYCWTSDSDDIRIAKNHRNRVKLKKNNDPDDYSNDIKKTDSNRRATLPFQHNSNKSPSKMIQRKSLNACAILEENSNSDAPLIHIVQELSGNKVISHVRVNKKKICLNENNYIEENSAHNNGKLFMPAMKKEKPMQKYCLKKPHIKNVTKNTFENPEDIEITTINSNNEKVPIQNLSQAAPRRRKSENSGKLLQKRLNRNPHLQNFNNKEPIPPKKPPRQRPLKIENIQQAEKVLDEFLSEEKYRTSRKTLRKTYPLDEKNKIEYAESLKNKEKLNKIKNNHLTSNPSCPSLNDFENSDNEVKFGWISPDVMKMLKTSNEKIFDTNKLMPESQKLGWVVPSKNKQSPDKLNFISENRNLRQPHKLDIDTVDGPLISDHNFVKNLESKDTPIKKELISNKNFKSQPSSPQSDKKDTQRSSFREKAAKGTKVFLKTSKQKLVKFVGKTPKETHKQNLLKKNVSVQTSLIDINDKSIHLDFGKSELFSDESPPGSYHSPVNNYDNKFDFNRNIKSPKSLSSHRKLNFSPKKLVQNFSTRNNNISDQNSGAYKSYEGQLNGDLSLTIMNDILLNIKSKLEASDEHAESVFEDVRQRTYYQQQQQCHSKASSNVDHSSKNDLLSVSEENCVQINALADIHNEPIYSEIEEDKIMVTGNPSIHNLNDISHYIVNNKAIYTEIKKSPRKKNSYRSEYVVDDFDDIREKHYEPNVSYESPAEESFNDATQSTPNRNLMNKKTVLGNAFPSVSEIGHDTVDQHRSLSCPPPIDNTKLNNHNILEDSISMQNSNESDIVKLKPLRNIKNKFQTSFRKGKFYFKNNSTKQKDIADYSKNCNNLWEQSNLNIDNLYTESSVQLKLEKTVNIFRSNPKLENSLEAIEAERLLLFSSLKNLRYLQNIYSNENKSRILITNFKFSVIEDMSNDIFFNYFYIGVFASENRIKSTSLALKNGREIVFPNCNVLFDKLNESSVIKCDIYILRLRKILNTENNSMNNSLIVEVKPNNSYTSLNELQSKFKLHGSLTLTAKNFAPFQFDKDQQNCEGNSFCLSSSNTTEIPIQIIAHKTPLDQKVSISGNLSTHFNKFVQDGFLNVQDLQKKHDWNRRWCKINIFNLDIWNYPQDTTEKNPIDSFDLIKCSNLELASKEDCARSRSFILTISTNDNTKIPVIFAADNQNDLQIWMNSLNQIINFVKQWIRNE